MNSVERFYPESRFGGFTDIDGTMAFFNRVNALLDSSLVVLDAGCERGAYGEDPVTLRRNLRILKGKVAKVIGIDVGQGARENPYLDEFRLIEGLSRCSSSTIRTSIPETSTLCVWKNRKGRCQCPEPVGTGRPRSFGLASGHEGRGFREEDTTPGYPREAWEAIPRGRSEGRGGVHPIATAPLGHSTYLIAVRSHP